MFKQESLNDNSVPLIDHIKNEIKNEIATISKSIARNNHVEPDSSNEMVDLPPKHVNSSNTISVGNLIKSKIHNMSESISEDIISIGNNEQVNTTTVMELPEEKKLQNLFEMESLSQADLEKLSNNNMSDDIGDPFVIKSSMYESIDETPEPIITSPKKSEISQKKVINFTNEELDQLLQESSVLIDDKKARDKARTNETKSKTKTKTKKVLLKLDLEDY